MSFFVPNVPFLDIHAVYCADIRLLCRYFTLFFMYFMDSYKCDALRDLVPFVQLQKREKHPWRSVTFSKVAGFSLQLY